jgi:hypothetical protein
VATIEERAFSQCENLSSLTLSDGLVNIDKQAFEYCKNLKAVTLPESLTTLEEGAFWFCNLKELTIPGAVSIVRKNAFYSNNALARLTISEGVSIIEEGAFGLNDSLHWVSLPKSLTQIAGSMNVVVHSTIDKPGELHFLWENAPSVDFSGLALNRQQGAPDIILHVPLHTKYLYLYEYLYVFGLKFAGVTIVDGTEAIPDQLIHIGFDLYLAARDVDPDALLLKVKISNEEKKQLLSDAGHRNAVTSIISRVYEYFNDDFDFIELALDRDIWQAEWMYSDLPSAGMNWPVSNNVQGIGGTYSNSTWWGSAGKLKSIIYTPGGFGSNHELGHQWVNYIIPTYFVDNQSSGSHWGITHLVNNGSTSVMGGYRYMRQAGTGYGKTKYQGSNRPDTNPDGSFIYGSYDVGTIDGSFSDIDLYLMGLKSAQELRNNNFRMDVYSDFSYEADVEQGYFYAGKVTSYTIDDIIRLNGQRIPDVNSSQKKFKVLAILATTDVETNSQDMQYFIKMLESEKITTSSALTVPETYTFYEATDGRGSIEYKGLNNSLKPQFRSLYR